MSVWVWVVRVQFSSRWVGCFVLPTPSPYHSLAQSVIMHIMHIHTAPRFSVQFTYLITSFSILKVKVLQSASKCQTHCHAHTAAHPHLYLVQLRRADRQLHKSQFTSYPSTLILSILRRIAAHKLLISTSGIVYTGIYCGKGTCKDTCEDSPQFSVHSFNVSCADFVATVRTMNCC